ncbi:MAG TPA: TetR/AcrR family transcriptional regulator [Thermodesulfovibrionales bacterium]|jgi:AcrR family transcriptional regulator|nr:TetR/AcrR family transcriptional regulator [Thermodesulfovibrionales bacterium]
MNKRSGIESKQKIMKAAMDVFSRKGYAKANIREIARTAGISVGGVYLYFKNKEELYRSLINERMLDIGSKTETIAGKTQSASEALSHFLSLHLENALKHKEFILLHIREHGFTFGVQEKKNFFRKQRELVERLIQRGIRTGEFRKCNADDMAKVIMGSLRGVILSMALDDDVHITPQMMNEFIFNGLHTPARK